jgi:hypothetical protein
VQSVIIARSYSLLVKGQERSDGYSSAVGRPFLELRPDRVRCIVEAYEKALNVLCLEDRDNPLTEMVAKRRQVSLTRPSFPLWRLKT